MYIINTDNYLLLSGIQHFAFCQRQWALIHIEQAWAESARTVEGQHLHERADDKYFSESRCETRIVRAMPLISHELRLRGVADVVEFHHDDSGENQLSCKLHGHRGYWRVIPVEYKRGRPKKDDRDAVQLCAQAMALEEMLGVRIEQGYLFYWQTRHRELITINGALRARVCELVEKMHEYFGLGVTPRATSGKHCDLCSLKELCQPRITLKHKSVTNYLREYLEE